MDFSLAALSLFGVLKAAEMGASAFLLGALGAVWGLVYFLVSLLLGRLINASNRYASMIAGCLLMVLVTVGLMWADRLALLFFFFALYGVAASLFYIGFQLFMAERVRLPIHQACGFYTLSWSLGIGAGSLAQGYLVTRGPVAALMPAVLSSLLVILVLEIDRHWPIRPGPTGPDPAEPPGPPVPASRRALFVRLGWLLFLNASFIGIAIRILVPKLILDLPGSGPAAAGTLVCLVFSIQAVSGFLLSGRHTLNYGFRPILATSLAGGAGLLAAWLWPGWPGMLTLAAGFGLYCGYAYSAGVFYALSQTEQSGRNIGINEAIVGVAGVLGPLAGGAALDRGPDVFHAAMLSFFLLLLAGQGLLFARSRRRPDETRG